MMPSFLFLVSRPRFGFSFTTPYLPRNQTKPTLFMLALRHLLQFACNRFWKVSFFFVILRLFDTFDSATDTLAIITGTGKGTKEERLRW